VKLQLAILKGILQVVVFCQDARTDEPHVLNQRHIGGYLGDRAALRTVADHQVAPALLVGRHQAFAQSLVGVELAFEDDFSYFFVENKQV
jgi:hypothetical protein